MAPSMAENLDPHLVRSYYKRLGPVRTVLDLGCGKGDLGRLKPDPAIEIYGVDSDPGIVSSASRFERVQTLDLERENLPFEDNFFDAVFAKDILEHLPKPWLLLREVRRVLKPGGRLLVSVPMAKPRVVWGDYTHIRGYTETAVRRLLEDAGFQILSVRKMGGIPLAGRLGLAACIPFLMNFPPVDWLWGASYELLSVKASPGVK